MTGRSLLISSLLKPASYNINWHTIQFLFRGRSSRFKVRECSKRHTHTYPSFSSSAFHVISQARNWRVLPLDDSSRSAFRKSSKHDWCTMTEKRTCFKQLSFNAIVLLRRNSPIYVAGADRSDGIPRIRFNQHTRERRDAICHSARDLSGWNCLNRHRLIYLHPSSLSYLSLNSFPHFPLLDTSYVPLSSVARFVSVLSYFFFRRSSSDPAVSPLLTVVPQPPLAANTPLFFLKLIRFNERKRSTRNVAFHSP